MKSSSIRRIVAGMFAVALVSWLHSTAQAQCVGCPTQTVAYSPVVAQPTLAFSPVVGQPTVTFEEYRGWYPGKWLDRMRLRRFGYTAPTTTTFAAAPMSVAHTSAFAPTSTTAYFTPSTPYVTAFAPLGQRSISRQVVLSPVVMSSPMMTSSIGACSPCDPCISCPTCPSSVGQASFSEAACPSCTPSTGVPSYSPTPMSPMPSNGSSGTPQPYLTPQEAAPLRSEYPPSNGTSNNFDGNGSQNGNGQSGGNQDPGPAMQDSHDANSYLEPPALFDPQDRTASRGPTVGVRQAVYRQPVSSAREISHGNSHRTQAEIDADGWSAVPSNR